MMTRLLAVRNHIKRLVTVTSTSETFKKILIIKNKNLVLIPPGTRSYDSDVITS